ncbi:MAG: NADH-ubiquinone oxidoreductase-F iron-sulfur binding region domain-containing protein [Acidimicrobiia bacterium]
MDLRFSGAEPSKAERAALEALLARDGPPRRDLLLPALHAVHGACGWISPGGLDEVCRRLGVAPAEAYGVASFYALFSFVPRPARVLHVCVDLACQVAGAGRLVQALGKLHTKEASWVESPCLGLCDRAPAALVTQYGEAPGEAVLAPAGIGGLLGALQHGPGGAPPEPDVAAAVPQRGDPSLVLLSRVGVTDPGDVDDYRAHGGYAALRRAVAVGPSGVIREVTESKLVGRGGAAFPAGRKWEAVAAQPVRPHELVCNADESEPGTFKDRVLLEGDPFAVLEAMAIAGYATGAERGFIYLRGEYPRALRILDQAIAVARERGFLGPDVMGLGFAFDVEVRRGAGAYICGEETAIFNSIEGYRGEPRNKPPFPTQVGLFGRPTLVNNVETLVNVLPILLRGAAAYAAVGTERSTGPKLFAVSGRVARPGVYEVPFGAKLGELVDLAGGTLPDRNLRAMLLGGAAGAFVGPDGLDLALSFEGAAAAGATLGSGVVMVLDDTVPLTPFLLRIAAFFRDESCGQCVPCRVGTVRQEEVLHRLATGRVLRTVEEELELLADVVAVMRDASICGLGQTAGNAIETAVARLGVFT